MGSPVEEKDLTFNRSVCSSLLTTEGNTVYGSKSGSFMDAVGGEDWSSLLVASIFSKKQKAI